MNDVVEKIMDESNLQYLTFELFGEEYGIDILSVQEIRGWGGVRNVPAMPDYIKGVLNLRGVLMPVMDLRVRFGIGEVDYTPMTVIIVISIGSAENPRLLGLVVDAVSDVLETSSDRFKQSPDFGVDARTRFMKGVVTENNRMVIVLDLEELLSGKEMDELSHIAIDTQAEVAVG